MLHSAAPAYTIQGKKQYIDRLNDGYQDSSPGPIYNTSELGIKTRSVSYKTGLSKRMNINHGVIETPSPDKYNNFKKQPGTSITIPKSERINQQSKNFNPQSTIYRANENFVKKSYPNYSMYSKYPSIMDNTGNNPGPGDYETGKQILNSQLKKKVPKFGSQKRFSEPLFRPPGVGDYKIDQQIPQPTSIEGTISKADRFPVGPDYPGPGAYQQKCYFDENQKKGKGSTVGQKLKGCFTLQSNTRESFGNYFRDQKPDFRRTYAFPKQRREIFKDNGKPGPGQYKPQPSQKKNPQAFIGTGKNVEYDTSKDNPGPGYYESPEKKPINYTFSKSKSLKYLNANPGVGRYQMNQGLSKTGYKSWSVGKGKRTNFVSKNIAGVGDYEILQKKTGGVSIPKASRFPKANQNPGPGDYQFQSTISNFNFYKKRTNSTQQSQKSQTK